MAPKECSEARVSPVVGEAWVPHGPVSSSLASFVSFSAPLITASLTTVVISVYGITDLATKPCVFCIKDLTTELSLITDLTTKLL